MRLASEGIVAAASWTARNSRTIARISDRPGSTVKMISLVMPTFRPRLMFLSNGYDWERLVDLGLTTSICEIAKPFGRALGDRHRFGFPRERFR